MPATLEKEPAVTSIPVPKIPLRPTVGPYTVADWVAFEEGKERKHELRNGEFYEMAGATYDHNVITGDLSVELSIALRGTGCETLPSDQKVYVDNTNGLYPDIVVVCGEPMITPEESLQNPVLIVEVLSPSTAGDDRGAKFAKHRTCPTLRHYLLVEQNEPTIEHFEKGENGIWSLVAEHHTLEETLTLTVSGATVQIPLTTIYRRVPFPVPAVPND